MGSDILRWPQLAQTDSKEQQASGDTDGPDELPRQSQFSKMDLYVKAKQVTLVPGDLTASSGLCRHCKCMARIHT